MGQAAILGVGQEPGAFHVNLFVANRQQKIICHHIIKDISLGRDVEVGLVKLAKLISTSITWSYNGQPSLPALLCRLCLSYVLFCDTTLLEWGVN